MELLYFFSVVQRNFLKILIGGIICGLLGILFATLIQKPAYSTTIIFQTTAKVDQTQGKDVDPLSYFEAGDRFSEAILGWFRNPIIFDGIAKRVEGMDGGTLAKIFSIRRQEKQNINITYKVESEEKAKKLEEAIVSYMKEQVATINKQSNSAYDLVNLDYKIEKIEPSKVMTGGYAFAFGIILFILFVFIYELAIGVVMYKDQVEQILGTKIVGKIGKNDSAFLASYIKERAPHASLIGLGIPLDDIVKNTKSFLEKSLNTKSEVTLTAYQSPDYSKGLHDKGEIILFVKPGVTKLRDIRNIKAVKQNLSHVFLA